MITYIISDHAENFFFSSFTILLVSNDCNQTLVLAVPLGKLNLYIMIASHFVNNFTTATNQLRMIVRVDLYSQLVTLQQSVLLFKLQAFNFLSQCVFGTLNIGWGTCDLDYVAMLVLGWDRDVYVVLVHEFAYVTALLSDDVAMEVKGNRDLFGDWNKVLLIKKQQSFKNIKHQVSQH